LNPTNYKLDEKRNIRLKKE